MSLGKFKSSNKNTVLTSLWAILFICILSAVVVVYLLVTDVFEDVIYHFCYILVETETERDRGFSNSTGNFAVSNSWPVNKCQMQRKNSIAEARSEPKTINPHWNSNRRKKERRNRAKEIEKKALHTNTEHWIPYLRPRVNKHWILNTFS